MKEFLRRIGWESGILLMYKLKELLCGIGDEAKGVNDCLIEYKLKELVCGPNKLFPLTSIPISYIAFNLYPNKY